uniref:Integrase core domain containing protein n=1 Tax=Solanum tuberosum TaxID=4113 RepID=M1DEE8_SOLTU
MVWCRGLRTPSTVRRSTHRPWMVPVDPSYAPKFFPSAASMAPSSSRSTPQLGAIVVPLARAELASLWANVDAILATPTVEPQAAPTALADDTVLDALFSGTAKEESAPTHTKGASSSAPAVEVPVVVRDVVSTIGGVVRVIESTTEGAMMDDVGTTDGDPTIVPAGSGKLDPPTC